MAYIENVIHRDIKFYLARISETALDQTSAAQCQNLLGATIKIEQAADIISQNMLTRARKKSERKASFSAEGWAELCAMHNEVLQNAHLAFSAAKNAADRAEAAVEEAREDLARAEARAEARFMVLAQRDPRMMAEFRRAKAQMQTTHHKS